MQEKVPKRSCIFVGGFITHSNREFIVNNSRRSIQFAADKLQRQYIEGINQYDFESVHVISFPFVGNYPRSFKSPLMNSELFDSNGKIISIKSYSTLPLLSTIEKRKIFLSYLKKLKNQCSSELILFFYSLTSEHLDWIKLSKKIIQDVKIVLIVPDLPIFMNPSLSQYHFYRLIKNIVIEKYRWIQSSIDLTVTITKSVSDYLRAQNTIVIEGISADISFNNLEIQAGNRDSKDEFVVLYTGTLDEMYGVRDMLAAFQKLRGKNIILKICGDGPMKNEVVEISKQFENIRYLGILNSSEVFEMQSNADLLINPRKNDKEFTKYSFPSKIMEYLSSGTPMLGYKLGGIPNEYFEYMYLIENYNWSLTESILFLSKLDKEEREKFGNKAYNFIKNNKLPKHQITKVLARLED